jgi:hypothetical protein
LLVETRPSITGIDRSGGTGNIISVHLSLLWCHCGGGHSPIKIKSYLRVEDSIFSNAIRPFEAVS